MSQQTVDSNHTILGRLGRRSRWLITELLVIVIGVLIALAIDEWRESAREARTENAYLLQLIADLVATEYAMSEATGHNAPSDDAAVNLVAAFETKGIPSLERLHLLLTNVDGFDNPVPVLATADALISTGELRLITDASTRSAITRYLARSRDYLLKPVYQLEEYHENLIIQLAILAAESGLLANGTGVHVHNESPADVKGFLANTEAYAIAVNLVDIKMSMKVYRESVTTETLGLRHKLQTEISPD